MSDIPLCPLLEQIPMLPESEYERGNVRKFPTGHVFPIEPDAADALPVGRRGQRNGLMYDMEWIGHDPHHWPTTVLPSATGEESEWEMQLEDELGGEDVTLSVGYEAQPDSRLEGCAETLIDCHVAACREGDFAEGAMWGAGDHLRRDGLPGAFATHDEASRRKTSSAMETAGRIFSGHYAGKGLGFEGMLAEQARLWQDGAPDWAVCWDISCNLANASHRDADGWRCYAVWLLAGGGRAQQSDRFWLLFPRHGVAIALIHGTWVSWHGRKLSHCTAVPRTAGGERMLSLFCSLPANLLKFFERRLACQQVLQQRSAGEGERGRALFERLHVGMRVTYRTAPCIPSHIHGKPAQHKWVKAHSRWALARVTVVTGTHVEVMVEGGSCLRDTLSVQQVSNRLVIRSE